MKMVYTTVRVNDETNWVSVEGKQNWTKDGALGDRFKIFA